MSTTIFERAKDEIAAIAGELKKKADKGTPRREFVNGLLRDVFLAQQMAQAEKTRLDDAAFVGPLVDASLAKLESAGVALFPDDKATIAKAQEKLLALRGERESVTQLRDLARPVLEDAVKSALHPQARAIAEADRLFELLGSPGVLKTKSGAKTPAEVLAAGRLLEALAMHVATSLAKGKTTPHDATIEKTARALEAWIESKGAQPDRPAKGSPRAAAGQIAVVGEKAASGVARDAVAVVAGAGFKHAGETVARAVVVVSPGASPLIFSVARELIAKSDPTATERVAARLAALEARAKTLLDDPKSKLADRGAVLLDIADTLRQVGALAPADEKHVVEALAKDLGPVELIVPVVGAKIPSGASIQALEVWSEKAAPGLVTGVTGLGLKVDGAVVRQAVALVSKGPPPAGAIEEIIGLLPGDDALAGKMKERLQRARTGDPEELGRALADMILAGRIESFRSASQRAMRAFLDEPPASLAQHEGWTPTAEFLDRNFEQLLEDGDEGQRAAFRLIRPYLLALTGGAQNPRLRAVSEALNSAVAVQGDPIGPTTRSFIFDELAKLKVAVQGDSSHARRLARAVSQAVRTLFVNENYPAAKELIASLATVGVKTYPERPDKLDSCPDAEELFHRFELRYDPAARRAILGPFEPAVAAGDGVETGSLTLSLGPAPRLFAAIQQGPLAQSRLRPALAKIQETITNLDHHRMLAELAGDATADRAFVVEIAKYFSKLLREVGWNRAEGDRQALGELFTILREDLKLEMLPGYLTYRELRALIDKHGEKIKVDVQRGAGREIVIEQFGAISQEEVLEPLTMIWKVGPPPSYLDFLKQLDWFKAVLDGTKPPLAMGPRVVDAILDFNSPDAGSVEGVVRSLLILVTWLATEHKDRVEQFTMLVRQAPGLELDFFPIPGRTYGREAITKSLDDARTPGAVTVVIDATKEEGQAIDVKEIAVYKEGRRVSDEPKAIFALKSASAAHEGYARALQPLERSNDVPGTVKSELGVIRSRMALVSQGPASQSLEVKAFKTLLQAHLVDPQYPSEAASDVHKTAVYLTKQLEKSGALKVDRFESAKTVDEIQKHAPKDGTIVHEEFCPIGSNEVLAVVRPLVILEGTMLQPAIVRRGIPIGEEEVITLDRILNDSGMRLNTYAEGQGKVVDAVIDERSRTLLPRTIKRIEEVRHKMIDSHKKGKSQKSPLPTQTAIRDLLMFIVDQIHRYDDVLAMLADRTYRAAFADAVFKDVVFRSAMPYLSQTQGISIDTAVVAGADVSVLTGKFKKETTGPKPKRVTNIIFSVVVPAYNQGGTNIRPALVRVGEY